MMVSPTLGAGSFTLLESARSASSATSGALAVLLEGSGSNWSACVIVAVLITCAGATTVAVRVSVCGAVVVTEPTVQSPVTLL